MGRIWHEFEALRRPRTSGSALEALPGHHPSGGGGESPRRTQGQPLGCSHGMGAAEAANRSSMPQPKIGRSADGHCERRAPSWVHRTG